MFSSNASLATLPAVQFGDEVRRRRRAAKLTLEALAEVSGLSANYIGAVERGLRDPSLSTMEALAEALEAPLGELLGGQGKLSPAVLEAARLLESSSTEMQEAVIALLRASRRRR